MHFRALLFKKSEWFVKCSNFCSSQLHFSREVKDFQNLHIFCIYKIFNFYTSDIHFLRIVQAVWDLTIFCSSVLHYSRNVINGKDFQVFVPQNFSFFFVFSILPNFCTSGPTCREKSRILKTFQFLYLRAPLFEKSHRFLMPSNFCTLELQFSRKVKVF